MKSLKSTLKSHYTLLDIGECILHKGFSRALNAFGNDIESLLIDIYYYFKHSAVQSSDFRDLQQQMKVSEHIFVRHVSSRWLTIETSLERFLEQYDDLKTFFESSPSAKKSQSDRCTLIKDALKKKHFTKSIVFKECLSIIYWLFKIISERRTLNTHVI